MLAGWVKGKSLEKHSSSTEPPPQQSRLQPQAPFLSPQAGPRQASPLPQALFLSPQAGPHQASPLPQAPFLSPPARTPPGLTSAHLSPSCRYTLGGSRAEGALVGQIPPSPAWCGGEGLGATMYSPEAPRGLRLSAQGPAAGEQGGQQAWLLGMQLLGSHTPPHSPGPAPSLSQDQLLFSLPQSSRKSSTLGLHLHPEFPPVLCLH